MRLVLLNLVVEPWIATAGELLDKYWHPRMLGEAIGARGHELTILQHFHSPDVVRLGAAEVRFIAPQPDAGARSPVADYSAIRAVAKELAPDAFHVFGTANAHVLQCAANLSNDANIPFSVSYHGGSVPIVPGRYFATRRALRNALTMYFPSSNRARFWRGIVNRRTHVVVAPELSSSLQPMDRAQAREHLGLEDEIVLAWAARLNANKDPLTVLRAVDYVGTRRPEIRLLMAYQSDECLDEVRAFLEERPALASRVRLMGKLDRIGISRLFSAADIFLQASHVEIGGNALVEAISCGAIPVVSGIPSFRVLTGDGRIGRHFRKGRHGELAAALLDLCSADLKTQKMAVRRHFRESLSYRALAETYESEFARMIAQGV